MGFCSFTELGAYVDIRLHTDAIRVLAHIQTNAKPWGEPLGVTVEEVVLAFGDVDIVASIKTALEAKEGAPGWRGMHPTERLARWVNLVRTHPDVASTSTRFLVHDSFHSAKKPIAVNGEQGGRKAARS